MARKLSLILAFAMTLLLMPTLAPSASASGSVAPSATITAVPAVSNGDFIQGIKEVMPSLRDQYTDKQLVKLAKAVCTAFKSGNSVKALDKVARKYLTNDEAMTLIALGTSAFCPKYWPKVQKFYDIGG
jgi:hypothetical protein